MTLEENQPRPGHLLTTSANRHDPGGPTDGTEINRQESDAVHSESYYLGDVPNTKDAGQRGTEDVPIPRGYALMDDSAAGVRVEDGSAGRVREL